MFRSPCYGAGALKHKAPLHTRKLSLRRKCGLRIRHGGDYTLEYVLRSRIDTAERHSWLGTSAIFPSRCIVCALEEGLSAEHVDTVGGVVSDDRPPDGA